MKTVKRVVGIVVGSLLIYAFTLKHAGDIEKAGWLTGTWEGSSSRGSIYETWTRAGDLGLSGKSYSIKEKDTVVFENIRLVQEPGGLYYIPTVKNQNSGLPVRFTAKVVSQTQLVFENKAHDFPQVISYTKTGENTLVAEISGTKNGQVRSQTFPMKKIK